jgi:hypothetical protein
LDIYSKEKKMEEREGLRRTHENTFNSTAFSLTTGSTMDISSKEGSVITQHMTVLQHPLPGNKRYEAVATGLNFV